MRRLLLTVMLFVSAYACGQTTTLLQQGGLGVSCNAVTAASSINPGLAGGCTSLALVTSGGTLPGNYTWQTIVTGSPASVSVTFVGSLDGTTWTTLDSNTSTTGTSRTVANANSYRFLGCVPGTLTGGSSPTITCQISVTSTAAGGGASVMTPNQGYWMANPHPYTAIANAVLDTVANRVNALQVVIPYPGAYTQATWWVQASAGDTVDFGLYSADGQTRILDVGPTVTAGTAAAQKSAPFTLTQVPAGVYYLAWTQTGTPSTTLGAYTTNADIVGILQAQTTKKLVRCGNTATAGALPSSLGTLTTGAAATVPIVLFEP